MNAKKPPTRDNVRSAIDTLEAYGRAGFNDPKAQNRGTCIGYSLYSQCEPGAIWDIAREAFEQWNDHLARACLDALLAGDFTLDGCKIALELHPAFGKYKNNAAYVRALRKWAKAHNLKAPAA